MMRDALLALADPGSADWRNSWDDWTDLYPSLLLLDDRARKEMSGDEWRAVLEFVVFLVGYVGPMAEKVNERQRGHIQEEAEKAIRAFG